MKKHFILALAALGLLSATTMAQATFKVGAGAQLVLGDVNLVVESCNFEVNGVLAPGTATVRLNGPDNINLVSGGQAFYKIYLQKNPGTLVTLQDSLAITDSLVFAATNNKIVLGNYNAHFGAAANISGYGNDNYFITDGTGEVRKANLGTSAFVFPVGFDASTYNPAIVIENGTADTIGVRCLQQVLDQGTTGAPINTAVVDASWEVTQAAPGNMNLDLVLQWEAGDELSNFDRNYAGIANYGAGKWNLSAGDCGAATGFGPYTMLRTGITDDGVFALFDCAQTLLPLDLLAFRASKQGETSAMLDWETANESNTSHFEIERSTNGKDWQQIGTMPAAGASNSTLAYRYLDEGVNAGGAFSSQFYYRLRMVDLDGKFEYSPVRSVLFSGKSDLAIYPNPTAWGIHIVTGGPAAEGENLQLKLYSLNGKLLLSQNIDAGGGTFYFPSSVPSGMYQVVIEGLQGHGYFTERLALIR